MDTVLLQCKKKKEAYRWSLKDHEKKIIVLISHSDQTEEISLSAKLKGRESELTLCVLVSPQRNQTLTLSTTVVHEGQKTKSRVYVRSILLSPSSLSYTGAIRIQPQATFADAYQTHDCIATANGCHVITKPILEILNKNVQCKHRASILPIPKNIIWYGNTRNLTHEQIEKLYLQGFVNKGLEILSDSNTKELVYNEFHTHFKHTYD